MSRLNSKSNKGYAEVTGTDEIIVCPGSGDDYNMTLEEVKKYVMNAVIIAGKALPAAPMVLDNSKKVVDVGGITMLDTYEPSDENDVATKHYIDSIVNNESSPVLVYRFTATYAALISGSAVAVIPLSEGAIIYGIDVRVTEAFNDSGTDILEVGITGDDDLFEGSIDLSTTGFKDVNDVTFPYVLDAATGLTITYSGGNADASAGLLEVYLRYAKF